MTITRGHIDMGGLAPLVMTLREWQGEGQPMQLHPGDLGWHWRFGADATAAVIRTWSRAGELLAVGMLDDGELRLAIAPHAQRDEELARGMMRDVTDPEHGVFPAGEACAEVPDGAALRELLLDAGWERAASWTQLHRDLREPVPDSGVRVEIVGPERAQQRAAVQRAAFDNSTFSEELWRRMASAPPYADARCLVAYGEHQAPVAAVTVWSAGAGRPGLLEPMGVHRDHRGHGYGRAITFAAAAALRQMGASSANVCTPTANSAAVITYRSAGMQPVREVPDLRRSA